MVSNYMGVLFRQFTESFNTSLFLWCFEAPFEICASFSITVIIMKSLLKKPVPDDRKFKYITPTSIERGCKVTIFRCLLKISQQIAYLIPNLCQGLNDNLVPKSDQQSDT